MGSGLSMSSVNKIKELAAAHEYGLALDIVDSQDLSKSLNPQFLRLCGDIYTYNKRYTDARRVLIMAHRIAPEAKRIIFSLVELYLKLGYMELAKTYYDMYMFDADVNSIETKQLQYVYGKAKHAPVAELESYLGRAYDENIDYEWSYETFLVYSLLDKQQEALTLALEYTAHFTDAPHCHVVADVLEGLIDIEKVFYDYAEACEDDDPEQEDIRREENKLLEADHLRMYPPEPEIVSMVDDNEELIDFTAKHKRKRFMKEQAVKEKETQDSESSVKDVEETSTKQLSEESDEKEETEETVKKDDEMSDEITDKEETGDISTEKDSEGQSDSEEIKQGFFKRAFSKLRLKDKTSWEEDHDDLDSEINSEKALKDAHSVFFGEDDEKTSEDASADELEESTETKESEEADDSNEADTDNEMEDISDIQEMLERKKSDRDESQAIVSDDFNEDGFEAESDSIEGLHEQSDISEEQEVSRDSKKSVIFEEVELAEEDEDDVPVDDFSSDEEDEFGAMNNLDDEYEGVFVGEVEGLSEEDFEDEEFEETSEDNIEEAEAEESEEILEEPEADVEEPEEILEEPEADVEEPEEILEEPEADVEEPEEILEESEADVEEPEEILEEPEADVEESEEISEETEADIEEPEEVLEEPEEVVEETETDVVEEPTVVNDDPWNNIKKNSLEFPVFRSSLFPEYHNNEEYVIKNHFEEIMEKDHSKLQENLQKEEQMQKEAEALLASLGIDLSSVGSAKNQTDKVVETKDEASEIVRPTILNKGPSRDDLKSSLKIDSTKREILRKLKEYR